MHQIIELQNIESNHELKVEIDSSSIVVGGFNNPRTGQKINIKREDLNNIINQLTKQRI